MDKSELPLLHVRRGIQVHSYSYRVYSHLRPEISSTVSLQLENWQLDSQDKGIEGPDG